MTDDLNLYPLRVFLHVARTGSVTQAARDLAVSQPAVSAHLRTMEARYGTPLFERTPRGMKLTPAGAALADRADRVFAMVAGIEAAVGGASSAVRGQVILAASSTPGAYLAPRILREFQDRYPEAESALIVGDSSEAIEWVREFRAPMGIVGETAADSGIERIPIAADVLRLTTAADDMLCRVKPIREEYLAERVLLLRERGSSTRTGAEGVLGAYVGSFRRIQEIASSEAIKQMVNAGLGVAVLSSWSTRLEEAAGLLRPVRDERFRRPRRFYAVRRTDRELVGASRALWDFLCHSAACEPDTTAQIEPAASE